MQEDDVRSEASNVGEEFRAGHGSEIPTHERLEISIRGLLGVGSGTLESECDLMPSRQQRSQQPAQVSFSTA
ncbi:MAG: hypothetical protein WDO69_22160 [Pseudomonadota bacterium]